MQKMVHMETNRVSISDWFRRRIILAAQLITFIGKLLPLMANYVLRV